MAKRFTDTNKYKKPFIRGLQGAYKLLWDYLYHDCDHAGIWIVDFEIAQIYLGSDMQVNKEDALKYFNEDEQRIIILNNGSKWFIPSFIDFQYGNLNPENRAHLSVINILKSHSLINDKGLTTPLQGCKDKDKDMVKDMDNDMDKEKPKKQKAIPFKKPTQEEFTQYFLDNDFSKELSIRAYLGYDEAGWHDSQGKQIKNWKQKCQHVWFKDANKSSSDDPPKSLYKQRYG